MFDGMYIDESFAAAGDAVEQESFWNIVIESMLYFVECVILFVGKFE